MNVTFWGRPVKSPALKLPVLLLLAVLLTMTLPLHFAKWAVDGNGFLVRDLRRKWRYEPGWFAVALSAVLWAIVLAVIL